MENNNRNLWFKRKRYGWGWTPVSWEGWVVLIVYVCFIYYFFSGSDTIEHSGSDVLINFAPKFIAVTLTLIFICYKKGESPKWMWGNDTKDK